MKKIGLFLLVIGYWLLVIGFQFLVYAQQETIEILTYYPAPFGVYRQIQVGQPSFFLTIDYHSITPDEFFNAHRIFGSGAANILISHDGITNDLVIGANGNVGIGHIPTIDKLHVDGGSNTAIYGVSTSSFGVHGESTISRGVYGKSENNIGVYGEAGATDVTNYGVYGKTSSISGYGVYGEGPRYSVYGESKSGIGVYGKSAYSYAGVFEGKVMVTSFIEAGLPPIQDRLGSNTTVNIFDIAELIPCAKDVEYTDVVIINPEKDREVMKCTNEKQSAAGIISENPQFCFGDREKAREEEPEKNWHFLALAGQVMVKVDASYGEINRGDLLTTSPTPGHAMKAKPIAEINGYPIYPQGYIVGKALEPLKEGKGKILVLVCLM